jgi:hypothetical protein
MQLLQSFLKTLTIKFTQPDRHLPGNSPETLALNSTDMSPTATQQTLQKAKQKPLARQQSGLTLALDPELSQTVQWGKPQRSGAMTILPILGPDCPGDFVGPLSGLKLAGVHTYGKLELANTQKTGLAIVPLHMGYIQDRAQNHALCSAAFLDAGQQRIFSDACCVQAAQGGYLQGGDQWFFILPLALRSEALSLKCREDYSKLWPVIGRLNAQLGLPERGHLEQVLSRERAYLNQFQSRFERLPNQLGAAFWIGDRLAGLELAPTAAYFAEIWMPLVCFSYGVAAMGLEWQSQKQGQRELPQPYYARDLDDLRSAIQLDRLSQRQQLQSQIQQLTAQDFCGELTQQFGKLQLNTLQSEAFSGQVVQSETRPVYASIFSKSFAA